MPSHQSLPPISVMMAEANSRQAARDEQHLALADWLVIECMRLYRNASHVFPYTWPDDSRSDSLNLVEEIMYNFTDAAIMHSATELSDILHKTDLCTLLDSTNHEIWRAFCWTIKRHCNGEIRFDLNKFNHADWLALARDTGPWAQDFYEPTQAESDERWNRESLDVWKRIFNLAGEYDYIYRSQVQKMKVQEWRQHMEDANAQVTQEPSTIHEDEQAQSSSKPPPQEEVSVDLALPIGSTSATPSPQTETQATEVTENETVSEPDSDGLLAAVPDNVKGETKLAMRMLTVAEGMNNPYGMCECCQRTIQQSRGRPNQHAKRLNFIPNGQCRVMKKRKFYRYLRCSACTTAQAKNGVRACNIANPIEKQMSMVEAVWTWKHKSDKGSYTKPLQPPAEVSRQDRERMLAGQKLLVQDYERVWDAAVAACDGDDTQARRYTADLPFLITPEELEAAITDMPHFIARAAARDSIEGTSASGRTATSSPHEEAAPMNDAHMEIAGSADTMATPPREPSTTESSTSGFTPINVHRHNAHLASASQDDEGDNDDDEYQEPRSATSNRKRAREVTTRRQSTRKKSRQE